MLEDFGQTIIQIVYEKAELLKLQLVEIELHGIVECHTFTSPSHRIMVCRSDQVRLAYMLLVGAQPSVGTFTTKQVATLLLGQGHVWNPSGPREYPFRHLWVPFRPLLEPLGCQEGPMFSQRRLVNAKWGASEVSKPYTSLLAPPRLGNYQVCLRVPHPPTFAKRPCQY